jgi:hypothetical protein
VPDSSPSRAMPNRRVAARARTEVPEWSDDFSVVGPDYLRGVVDDFHLLTTNRRSEVNERRQFFEEAFRELARMHQALKVRATSAGRPYHEELFFFAVCLGEAFTILTGLRPIFDHILRTRSKAADWRSFLDASFIMCGLAAQLPDKAFKGGGYKSVKGDDYDSAEGMPGDLLIDKLRLGPPRKEGDRNYMWTGYFEELAREFAEPTRPWRQHQFASLNSFGLEADYGKEVPDLSRVNGGIHGIPGNRCTRIDNFQE